MQSSLSCPNPLQKRYRSLEDISAKDSIVQNTYAKQEIAVLVENVSEKFRLYHDKGTTLKEALVRLGRGTSYEDFWALKDVSFKVEKGVTLGIVGENGSGKSTLLKCIAKVLTPTKGRITVNGRVSALLELGAGFHPDLTGRENIYLNGSILGLKRKEIAKRFDEIVDFAELHQFIDIPVKNYSSGMYARLGFAVAINVNPEILLVDEVLAVGDVNFQNKCYEAFRRLKREGKTIILVSHTLSNIREFCDRVLLLNQGTVVCEGPTDLVLSEFERMNINALAAKHAELNKLKQHSKSNIDRWGSGEVRVSNVQLLNHNGVETTLFKMGERLVIRIYYDLVKPVSKLNFGVGFYASDGTYCSGINTAMDHISIIPEKNGVVDLVINQNPFLKGNYYINIVAFGDTEQLAYDWLGKYAGFIVDANKEYRGLIALDHSWEGKIIHAD